MAGAHTCPVKKLRRQEDIAWRVFFLQTAHRRNANNPADVEGTERVDVRPVIQFMRQNPVPASVSRQKINAATRDCSADDRIGRDAEGRIDFVFGQIRKAFQVIETAAADNSDGWLIHTRRQLKRERKKKATPISFVIPSAVEGSQCESFK